MGASIPNELMTIPNMVRYIGHLWVAQMLVSNPMSTGEIDSKLEANLGPDYKPT